MKGDDKKGKGEIKWKNVCGDIKRGTKVGQRGQKCKFR